MAGFDTGRLCRLVRDELDDEEDDDEGEGRRFLTFAGDRDTCWLNELRTIVSVSLVLNLALAELELVASVVVVGGGGCRPCCWWRVMIGRENLLVRLGMGRWRNRSTRMAGTRCRDWTCFNDDESKLNERVSSPW